MTRASSRRLLQVGTWLVATFLIVFLARTVDLGRVWALGQDVHPAWIAAAIASNLLLLPLWSEQWRMVLPPAIQISARRMLSLATQMTFFGNGVPGSGPVSAVVLLSREPGITPAAALSALALEQVTEGVVKVCVLLLSAQLLPLPGWMHRALLALAIAVAALTAAVVVSAFHHERIARLGSKNGVILSEAKDLLFVDRLLLLAARWSRDLESLRRPSRFASALLLCTGTKVAEALAIVAVQHAFGLTFPISTTVLVLAAALLGSIAPLAPANVGIYEGAVVAAYRYAGVAPEMSLALAVAQHACLLLGTAAVGYVVFSLKRFTAARAAG